MLWGNGVVVNEETITGDGVSCHYDNDSCFCWYLGRELRASTWVARDPCLYMPPRGNRQAGEEYGEQWIGGGGRTIATEPWGCRIVRAFMVAT